MGSLGDEDENCNFFDAMEQIEEDFCGQNLQSFVNCEYDLWIAPLRSVKERRINFIQRMGWSFNLSQEAWVGRDSNGEGNISDGDTDRIMETSGAVLRTSSSEDNFSSGESSVSGMKFDESVDDEGSFNSINGRGMPKTEGKRELENCSVLPRMIDQLRDKWLRRWRPFSRIMKFKLKEQDLRLDHFDHAPNPRVGIVQARHCGKKMKELSALFACQNIQAHEGAIISMKFSHDGQYLASAGEDKVLKVWQVVVDERSDIIDITDLDPSCVFFSMNHLSRFEPLRIEKDDSQKKRSFTKAHESACIIFPQRVFRILEKPLHTFWGHKAEILDLSWSKNDCLLLSSSADKTVRLWKLGVKECLKVFPHIDYVTCVCFNPVNDDYFISGSIDGKVRIWTISVGHVVLWSETKDIITAVSYSSDGKNAVCGSISGTCSFFSISDDHLQLGSQVCLTSKKKSPCKRITGVQFLPQDQSKVLVTCADSNIRIIDGVNVISKYKGLRNACGHVSATFTPYGKHIISASEDSNIYLWNYDSSSSSSKTIRFFEFLPCDNVSVAVPWPGLKCNSTPGKIPLFHLPFPAKCCFPLSHVFPLDSNSKGSATWPEEKLSNAYPKVLASSPLGKSLYKLFKNSCQSSSSAHSWGLVFVTASCNGRIRSFHNYGLPVPL